MIDAFFQVCNLCKVQTCRVNVLFDTAHIEH